MTLTDEIIQAVSRMPADRQKQVLEYIKSMQGDEALSSPFHEKLESLRGMFQDSGVSITEEDISEARKEMWGNFPRDFPK